MMQAVMLLDMQMAPEMAAASNHVVVVVLTNARSCQQQRLTAA